METVNTDSGDDRTLVWQNSVTSGTKAITSQIKELKYNTDRLIDEINMHCETHNSTVNTSDYASYKETFEYCNADYTSYKTGYDQSYR